MSFSIEDRIKKLVNEIARLDDFSPGQLAMELANRLPLNTQLRITAKGVRVTHSAYIDKLKSADDVDLALSQNLQIYG